MCDVRVSRLFGRSRRPRSASSKLCNFMPSLAGSDLHAPCDDMAKAAAAYIHPRLASVEQSVETETVQHTILATMPTDEEWERRYCTPREKQISKQ